jgi:hypothetical protein
MSKADTAGGPFRRGPRCWPEADAVGYTHSEADQPAEPLGPDDKLTPRSPERVDLPRQGKLKLKVLRAHNLPFPGPF